ncbi:MAG TPA: hypothetical protein VK112_06875 [Fodinibius sp.]|nr:hypothetical protein [Fodinibius sp.]
MNKILKILLLITLFVPFTGLAGYAQDCSIDIKKINADRKSWFRSNLDDIKWSGDHNSGRVELDWRQTNEIRARLQSVYGNPTVTVEDNIRILGLNVNTAIEFEYWFLVNDTIPLMVMDIGGPFFQGVIYALDNNHIELMDKIKCTLSDTLMSLDRGELANYEDYYYSINHQQWYRVSHKDGAYLTEEISSPKHIYN